MVVGGNLGLDARLRLALPRLHDAREGEEPAEVVALGRPPLQDKQRVARKSETSIKGKTAMYYRVTLVVCDLVGLT